MCVFSVCRHIFGELLNTLIFTLVVAFGIQFNQVGTLEGLKGQKFRLLFKITDKKKIKTRKSVDNFYTKQVFDEIDFTFLV